MVDDQDAALELTADGHAVVLVIGPGVGAVRAAGPGRLAVLVTDGEDASAVAAEMDRELFGPATASPSGPARS